MIFRGSSSRYIIKDKKNTYFDDNSSEYIYIYSDKEATIIGEYGIHFCRRQSDCYYFSLDDYQINTGKFKFRFSIINNIYNGKNWDKEYISYMYRDAKTDTLFALNNNMMKNFIKEDIGFKYANIPWFPPYLVKVKKIDYNKFKEQCSRLKYAHFKDPRKFGGKVLHVDKPY
ncbi:hypothetical protein JJC04_01950 [Flavobacterium covae]|nr:hypothetical protein [Flavobacterium covae]QYS91578.1 hypothetical protein JJC04_01950 [Flavobacterium covae]